MFPFFDRPSKFDTRANFNRRKWNFRFLRPSWKVTIEMEYGFIAMQTSLWASKQMCARNSMEEIINTLIEMHGIRRVSQFRFGMRMECSVRWKLATQWWVSRQIRDCIFYFGLFAVNMHPMSNDLCVSCVQFPLQKLFSALVSCVHSSEHNERHHWLAAILQINWDSYRVRTEDSSAGQTSIALHDEWLRRIFTIGGWTQRVWKYWNNVKWPAILGISMRHTTNP